MKLENLFESNYKMLLNEVKSSIETRAGIQQVINKFNIPYNDKLPIYDQDYPTPSSRSQMLKAVNSNIYSLQTDITNFLKENDKVLPSSIKWTQSNFVYQETNERSLSRHITFNLKEFPDVLLNIKISDHYLKNNVAKSGTGYVYFTRVTSAFADVLRNNLTTFINSVYKRIKFERTGEKDEPVVVKQTITPRDETEVKPVKPQPKKKIRNSVHLEIDNSLPSSRETYNEMIAPTKEGIKYGFYYNSTQPFTRQEFPNEEVKDSYEIKFNNHLKSLVNDIAKLLYHIDKIDNDTIVYNKSSSVNPDGSLSTSTYVTFKYKNHHTYGIIRIQDHSTNGKTIPNASIYNMRQSAYLSQAVKEKLAPWLKYLYTLG